MQQDKNLSKVMQAVVTAVMVLIGGAAGYQTALFAVRVHWWPAMSTVHPIITTVLIVLLSALCGFILSPVVSWGIVFIGVFFESKIQNIKVSELTFGLVGLIVGLLLANLIAIPLMKIPWGLGIYIAVILNLALGYWGVRFFYRRGDDMLASLSNIDIKSKLPRRKKKNQSEPENTEETEIPVSQSIPKILDTSAIIDGRVLDVARAGFLEGSIVLPRFVLTELQAVADSTEPLRRSRGRKGLSIVAELQKVKEITVEIPEISLSELGRPNVDEALVVLAKRLGGKVITTDYNLNKVTQIEGVSVLNVNDLANSLKPMLLPGEKVEIDIIRPGKENHQGIGYLDDGTMLVVEDGYRRVGERAIVTITSMLQTSAGRMAFGRINV